jgi:hypothetical protein
MSGNCDLSGWEVNQDIIQICARSYTTVPTTSHVTHVALERDEAVTPETCMCDVTSSDFGFRTGKFQYFCDLLLRVVSPSDPVIPQTPSLSRGTEYLLPFGATLELDKLASTAKHISITTHINTMEKTEYTSFLNTSFCTILHHLLSFVFIHCRWKSIIAQLTTL